MSWTILVVLVVAMTFAVVVAAVRSAELAGMAGRVEDLRRAREKGSRDARLRVPHVDLSRCLGCGTCVQACPEEGVLQLIHGQAIVVHGARCVGHGACAAECPTGSIALTFADLEKRDDIPAIDEHLEVPGRPGMFLAGEVTGYALIRTAITHGAAVAEEVAARSRARGSSNGGPPKRNGVLDLCIVGAGPAGLACSLGAKQHGLAFVTLEQGSLGGTVASYPRRKLVMTQPVDLPLAGRMKKSSYEKEELMRLWGGVAARHELPIRTGVRFEGVLQREDGSFEVRTSSGSVRARHVCLALGRRGTPRKLGVPGEDLPKVAYSLLDAQSYENRRILVVGGGDSAIEAALGLAEQAENRVTLSYRREAFFRIKTRNEERVDEAIRTGRVQVLFSSDVSRIDPSSVDLEMDWEGERKTFRLPNDDVFVLAGGTPPFGLLSECGVSFDPRARGPVEAPGEQGTGLLRALQIALAFVLAAAGWVAWHVGYYSLPVAERPASPLHELLRPSGTIGLAFGFLAAALIVVNLLYLGRRSRFVALRWGSLRAWMTAHVGTGILALLFALLHGSMAPQHTVGGHALAGLCVLVVTGAIGRYFYSQVPRAANGRELALDEVRAELASLGAAWDREDRAFGAHVREAIDDLVARERWTGFFLRRVWAMVRARVQLAWTIGRLRKEGRAEGIHEDRLRSLAALARRAYRAALMATHYEDLRGILSSWRYLHRWVALLMVLLVVVHVFTAMRYGAVLG